MKLVDGLTEEDYGVSVSAMLQYVVDYLDNKGMLEDHVFTFPDGSTWAATGHLHLDGTEELYRDAMRYRWLRDSGFVYLHEGADDQGWCPNFNTCVDEAADKALNKILCG